MTHFETVEEFVVRSKSAATVDELADCFQLAIERFGFDYFALVPCSGFDSINDNTAIIDRFPRSWSEQYIRERYFEFDPVFGVARKELLPFGWDSPSMVEGLSRRQRNLFAEASETGLRYGLSIPIHVWEQQTALISVAGVNKDLDPSAVSAVHLMAMYFYNAAMSLFGQRRLELRDNVSDLSPFRSKAVEGGIA